MSVSAVQASSGEKPDKLPRLSLDEIRFVSGDVLSLSKDDIILVVGPNNVGKTELIRAISRKLKDSSVESPVVESLAFSRIGNVEDVLALIRQSAKMLPSSTPANAVYQMYGENIRVDSVEHLWQGETDSLQALCRYFSQYLTTEERLTACRPPNSIALTRQAPTHPIHVMQSDDSLEQSVSSHFDRAFAIDLIVHRNAGREVPLYTGEKPALHPGEDRVSLSYIRRLEMLAPLTEQGDGMRSFATVLLYTTVGRETVLLIDEPEAFLHPPQARLLGRLLVEEKPDGRQLIAATHSGDVVRGVLDSGSSHARVLRLNRIGNTTAVSELSNTEIKALWSDSLLRHSNVLDGLFHKMVVVCESDSDARFYSAMASAMDEEISDWTDVMFTHTGGKQRLPAVARALSSVSVPVRVVADFDILREKELLRGLVEAVGADWEKLDNDWKAVKSAVDGKKAKLNALETASAIRELLDTVTSGQFPQEIGAEIRKTLSRSSPWGMAKSLGKPYIPSGTPASHCENLLANLGRIGIHVVPVGEVEGFLRTIGGHGQKWVNEVLQLDLSADVRLEDARRFTRRILQ